MMKSGTMPTPLEIMEADPKRQHPDLAEKREKTRTERLRAREYERYLLLFGGHERFPALLEIEHLLRDRDYWKCLNLV